MLRKLQLFILFILCLSSGLLAQEVVLSDEFDSGDGRWNSGWIDNTQATATATIDNTGKLSGTNSYKIAIVRGSADTYRIQRNANLPLFPGYQYDVSFMAVSDKDATINVLFEISGDPYTKRLNETAQVTTTPQTFTYTVSSSEDVPTNQLKLHFGGPQNDNSTIWVDKIIVTRIADPTLVSKWGFLNAARIGNWKFTPVTGGASMGGDTTHNVEWAAIRGEFNDTLTATTSEAVVVTGDIEFVGAGIDTWSGIRYGLFMHDAAGTLITSNVDSTRWSGVEGNSHGYMFTPVSGVQSVTDGASGGRGTNWIRVSGNYISTSNGSGPIRAAGYNTQKPYRAVADEGKYAFAFAVQPLTNGTKEVRFYLIKGDVANSARSTYYFGGSFIDTTAVAPSFNGVAFAVHTGGSGANPDLREVILTNVKADLGSPFTLPEAPWQEQYLEKWGFLNPARIGNWKFIPDPDSIIGNAGMGGDSTHSTEWAAIRAEFPEPVTATQSKAIIVTGNIEFVGAGIDTWSGIRYGMFMHDSAGTLITSNIDSTRWSGQEAFSHGYMFTPVSGVQSATDGVSGGRGTNWIRVSGNYISTSANSGPIRFAGNNTQKPYRAVADEGKYAFAFAAQPLADGTKEVRFYLIKGDVANSARSTYYFGGSFIDTTTIAPTFNGVAFALHTGGSGANPDLRQVLFTDVKVDMGPLFTLPEAPWQEQYLEKWGFLNPARIGNWKFIPDPDSIIGNAGMGGDSTHSTEWAAIRGEFPEPVTATQTKAIIVTGDIEFVGAGIDTWSGIRYGMFMHDSAGTLITSNIDSTRWSGSESYSHGYMFTPVSGVQSVTDGASGGRGTNWIRVSGNYISTSSGSGPIRAAGYNRQKPLRAVADEGKYAFAFAAKPLADGTKEVRFYLIKGDVANSARSTYYFGGSFIDTTTIAPTYNGVAFALHTGGSGANPDLRQVILTNVKVDMGPLFTLPEAPWNDIYVSEWGFNGGTGGWSLVPDPDSIVGNISVEGSAAATGLVALRGSFGDYVEPKLDSTKAIVITGNLEFVGGGFEAANSFSYGIFKSDSAGTIQDSAWSGTDSYASGYLFIPRSGTNALPKWGTAQTAGSFGAVVNGKWSDFANAANYALGNGAQIPADVTATVGDYAFALSVFAKAGNKMDVRYTLEKSDKSYFAGGWAVDSHSPLAATSFNGIGFALNTNTGTKGLKLTDVKVAQGKALDLGKITDVNDMDNSLPKAYALSQNYPNPFNPTTTIKFALPKAGSVSLIVYDILGRNIATLINSDLKAGYHTVNFNASHLASGVYFYRLEAGDFTSVKKLMLMK